MSKRKRKACTSLESPPEKKSDLPTLNSSTEQKQLSTKQKQSPTKSSIKATSTSKTSSSISSPTVTCSDPVVCSSTKVATSTGQKRPPSERLPKESSKTSSLKSSPSKLPSSSSLHKAVTESGKKDQKQKQQSSSTLSLSTPTKNPISITTPTTTEKQCSTSSDVTSSSKKKKKKKKKKKQSFDHLSEEERVIVVGFSPSPKKIQSMPLKVSKIIPVKTVQKEFASPTTTPLTSTNLNASSSSLSSHSSSDKSLSLTLTPSSAASASSSSISDCSILMEVKKAGKMVFINPFLPSSPPPAKRKSSESVIVIEDSPISHSSKSQPLHQGSPICTSTPRPSMGIPSFNIFPSPIDRSEKTFQNFEESSIRSLFSKSPNSTSTNDVTVVNRIDVQGVQDDVIIIEDDLTNREEEEMEVDDDVAIITLIDARENTMLLESETVGILTETVAQKSTIMETSSHSDDVGSTVVAIDTNVFIHALRFVIDVLKHPLAVSGQLFVLLPWVVLQELDYLKNRLGAPCRVAVRFINNQLMTDNPQLISQSPMQAAEKLIPVESNDDKILVCCLQRMKTYKKDRVILVTRDINLSSKAIAAGIESADNQTIWNKLLPASSAREAQPMTSARQQPSVQPTRPQYTSAQTQPSVQPTRPQHIRTVQNDRVIPSRTQPPTQPMRPVHIGQTIMESPLPNHQRMRVVSKLSYVWDLISYISGQVDFESRPNHEVTTMIARVLHQMDILHKQFEKCLMLAPTLIWNHTSYFQGMTHTLNNFTKGYRVPNPDRTENVTFEDMMRFFKDINNRPQLYTGLQNLKETLHHFRGVRYNY